MTTGSEIWTLLRVLLSLVVVLSLAVVLLRYGLPWLQKLQGFTPARGQLEIVQIVALDRLHKLAVVRYAGRELLLGIGGGGVRRLAIGAAPTNANAPAQAAEDDPQPAARRA